MNKFGTFVLGLAIGIGIGYFGATRLPAADPEARFTECLSDASTRQTDTGVRAAAEVCRRQRKATQTKPSN